MIFPGPTLCHHPAQYVQTHCRAAIFLPPWLPSAWNTHSVLKVYLTRQLFDLS